MFKVSKQFVEASVAAGWLGGLKKLRRKGVGLSIRGPLCRAFLRGRTKTSKRLQSECLLSLPLRKNLQSEAPSGQLFLRGRQKQANGCRVSAFHFWSPPPPWHLGPARRQGPRPPPWAPCGVAKHKVALWGKTHPPVNNFFNTINNFFKHPPWGIGVKIIC